MSNETREKQTTDKEENFFYANRRDKKAERED